MSEKALLSETLYALGEAITNTQIAMDNEENPLRISMLEEDLIYFYDLKERIEKRTEKLEYKKRFEKNE